MITVASEKLIDFKCLSKKTIRFPGKFPQSEQPFRKLKVKVKTGLQKHVIKLH
jgi:hypothetical protein